MALKASTKRLVITDESVNNHGFRALTDGVDISQYERNPIMLWMHNRPWSGKKDEILPIGNVLDLKKEGTTITGLPHFDDTDPFAMSIYEKWESGVLRMGSAALLPITWSDDPKYTVNGQTGATLVTSILREVSIADIGSNNNCLQVELCDANGQLIKLSDNTQNIIPKLKTPETNMEPTIKLTDISPLVGLTGDNVTLADITAAITKLKTDKATADQQVITLTDKVTVLTNAAVSKNIDDLVDGAAAAKKITLAEVAHYKKLAAVDFETTKAVIDGLQPVVSLKDVIETDATMPARAVELMKLSADELWRTGQFEELQKLYTPGYEIKMKELKGEKK